MTRLKQAIVLPCPFHAAFEPNAKNNNPLMKISGWIQHKRIKQSLALEHYKHLGYINNFLNHNRFCIIAHN